MSSIGITRDVDRLGRIVIPKPIRRNLNINEKDKLQISTDGDTIIIKKYEPFCIFCGSDTEVIDYKEKKVCKHCLEKLKNL